MFLYEILVPTVKNNGKPIKTRCHREWDRRVRRITKGLTILAPAKGQWISPDGELFAERMIPVRIMCKEEEIEEIVNITAKFYEQKAVMYYCISNDVKVIHFGDKNGKSSS